MATDGSEARLEVNPSPSQIRPVLRGMVLKIAAAVLLSVAGSQAHAQSALHCADAATEQATKLLEFHYGAGSRIEIDKNVKAISPIHSPANKKQSLDVLEVWGYVYKAQYRMHFIYARVPGQCVLMGQEILEYASL